MVGAHGRTVAVTGVSGYIGRRFVESASTRADIARIVGFDVKEPRIAAPRLVFDRLDVRDPALERRLAGVDVLVHLAFVMDPIRDEAAMRDVNVNGSHNAFHCAIRAGVPKIVYLSSAVVYGAHPDNDFPLTESSPLRANLDFSYPAHKLEVEYAIRDLEERHPDVCFTVLRPAVVLGPTADNAWSRALEFPFLFAVEGYRPPLQFVHEDDVAEALCFAIDNDLDGAYNLAAEEWMASDEILEVAGKRVIDLPEHVAFGLVDRMWAAGLADAPAGMLHYIMHPWVVSSDKLAGEGFWARRSNLEALTETVSRARRHVRIGPARVRRRDLTAGAAGVGAAAAVAGLWTLRRRSA